MIAKFRPCSRRSCAIVLTILVLLACVGGVVSVKTDSNVVKPESLDRPQGHLLRGFQTNRSLRTFVAATEDDVNFEERAITDIMKQIARAAKNKLAPNDQATTNKLFNKLQINKEADEQLFQSRPFQKWVTTVTKNFKKTPELAQASMASSLVSHFGDEALAKLLASAKNNYRSRDVATQLEKAQIQNWSSAGKTEDEIFALLKLNDKGERLFESPVAATWISYVIQLNKQNSDEVIFASLKKMYDDDALVKMIAGAKSSTSTGAMAKKLEQVQLNEWTSEGKSVDDIFELLKLNNQGEKLFQSPVLSTWISYANLQGKNPYDLLLQSRPISPLSELRLTNMIVAAKGHRTTASIGTKLLEAQSKMWLSTGKTADDVFKSLQLNDGGDHFFARSVWSVWVSYLTKLNRENPDELMFTVVKTHYGDEGMAKTITLANEGLFTKDIGRKLEEELWRSQGKDGADIFKLLKLDKEGNNVLESPVLSTWISYVTKLNALDKKTPDAISQLEKRFHGDLELARLINYAKQKTNTGAARKVIVEVQDLQFNKWLAAGETPNSMLTRTLETNQFYTWNTKVVLQHYYDFYKDIAVRTGKVQL